MKWHDDRANALPVFTPRARGVILCPWYRAVCPGDERCPMYLRRCAGLRPGAEEEAARQRGLSQAIYERGIAPGGKA